MPCHMQSCESPHCGKPTHPTYTRSRTGQCLLVDGLDWDGVLCSTRHTAGCGCDADVDGQHIIGLVGTIGQQHLAALQTKCVAHAQFFVGYLLLLCWAFWVTFSFCRHTRVVIGTMPATAACQCMPAVCLALHNPGYSLEPGHALDRPLDRE